MVAKIKEDEYYRKGMDAHSSYEAFLCHEKKQQDDSSTNLKSFIDEPPSTFPIQ